MDRTIRLPTMNRAALRLYGRPAAPPAPETFRAGPLRLLYEPASGFVRRIRLGDAEVLRGIYAAVRDHDWNTVPGTLVESRRDIGEDAFHVEFACHHRLWDIDFAWHGSVSGTAEGVLRYSFAGEARSTFRRNRIGFCVLHPIRECAGVQARQRRVDGSVEVCRFPDAIEPQIFGRSRFRDLRGVAHEVEPGVWAEVEFEGDVFEMEDQRNWTDASFKTYCTPLALPFPVEIRAGTRIRQDVTLRLDGWRRKTARPIVAVGDPAVVGVCPGSPSDVPWRFPRIGLGFADHEPALGPSQARRLQALGLAHLRVDLRLASPEWPGLWERAVREATQLGVNLELALHLPREGRVEADAIRRRLASHADIPTRILALREGEAATSAETLAAVRGMLPSRNLCVGAGSDANFCELNREQALSRCAIADADFLFWSINPQVHAFDDLSVMETLEAQAATIRSARTFAGGKPLVVTPVTLRPRFNPVAIGPEPPTPPGELPRQVDPRQAGWFAAAWTLGSFVGLARAGVDAITCFETIGWRGVLEREEGSPLPERFASVPDGVFPIYHALAEFAGFAGAEILPWTSTAPRSVAALGLRHDCREVLLLANLESRPCTVDTGEVSGLPWVRILGVDEAESATPDPAGFRAFARQRAGSTVELPAFGIACLGASS